MTSKNPLLPSEEQCCALTDEQCHRIQAEVDPQNIRGYKTWEVKHQPTLIRLYMTGKSFPLIADAMKYKLEWSYKTYANRYRDWLFPVNQIERQHLIMELYALVSGSNNSSPSSAPTPPQIRPPMRQLQPVPPPPPPMPSQPLSVPRDFLFPVPVSPRREINQAQAADRMSILSTNTSSSASSQSMYSRFDDVFSNPRFSVATTNSSLSDISQFSVPIRSQPQPQGRPMRPPKHDPQAGLWNGVLRVIPCGKYHHLSTWDMFFPSCVVCGFNQWHALMLHARSMTIGSFVAAMSQLRDIGKVDFAGNYPVHFLLSAGVGIDYFSNLLPFSNSCGQNVFGQNPLHVLNPQDLEGEQLISFLEWFKARERPPGLLLTQRDIICRTPLHNLLQYPFERGLYQKIVKVFPFPEHQLRSTDTSNQTAIMLMSEISYKIQSESPSDFAKIQAGITEVKLYLSGAENNQNGNAQRYGFHDIARGARGTSYGYMYYQCLICNQINTHSSSYLDQMVCACKHKRDRNAPDDTGMTPAHALITQVRCNNDAEPTDETPAQTAELFRVLLPRNDPTLREALHVLDPQGNNLIHNIAVRGFDEILEYALSLEEERRRPAMVNACSKKSGDNAGEWSILEAVQYELVRAVTELKAVPVTRYNGAARKALFEKATRLKNCRGILINAGAEMKPSVTARWRISG